MNETRDGSAGSTRGAWRIGFVVVGLVAAAWLACFRYPDIWNITGIGEANRPFMDLHGILAARDAAQAGVNPFLPNDFDPYHRPHVYSTWWLVLPGLDVGRADTLWLGAILLGAFLAMAVGLTRPRTIREGLGLVLLLVSPAMLLAVNRANNDLVVFILIGLGLLCFRSLQRAARTGGVLLLAFAAVLKYSPVVALVVLLDLRSRRDLAVGLGLCAMVLLLAWPGLVPGLKSAAQFMPVPEGLYAYGAPMLGRNLGVTEKSIWLLPAAGMFVWALLGAIHQNRKKNLSPVPDDSAAEREFICGAAMLVGLFFLGSSYGYKLIFAVWVLPWLWRKCGGDPAAARWGRATGSLLFAVVWLEGGMAVLLNLVTGIWSQEMAVTLLKATLFTTQLLTWALIACLLRFLLVYIGRRLHVLFGRETGAA